MLFLGLLSLGALASAPLVNAQTTTPSPTPLVNTPAPTPTPDISIMVARLKAAKSANKPFIIYYEGTQVTVPDANHLAYNPSGKFTNVLVFSGDDTIYSIPVNHITKLVLVSSFPFDPQ